MAEYLIRWCNWVSPQSETDDMIIRYGAELLIDNLARLLLILILGAVAGRGYETILILAVFCGIRSQAGEIHAKTRWGCGVSMAGIWLLSLLGGQLVKIPVWFLDAVYFVSLGTTLALAPQTVNREYYTESVIREKGTALFLIICLCVAALSQITIYLLSVRNAFLFKLRWEIILTIFLSLLSGAGIGYFFIIWLIIYLKMT